MRYNDDKNPKHAFRTKKIKCGERWRHLTAHVKNLKQTCRAFIYSLAASGGSKENYLYIVVVRPTCALLRYFTFPIENRSLLDILRVGHYVCPTKFIYPTGRADI